MERVKKGVSCLLILAMCLPLVLQCAGTVSAAEGGQEYCVQLDEVKNGRLKLGDSEEKSLNYRSKDKVTIRIYPKEGFQLEKLEVLDAETGGEEMVMTWNNEEELSFQMPAKNVLVRAYFEKAEQKQETETDESKAQDLHNLQKWKLLILRRPKKLIWSTLTHRQRSSGHSRQKDQPVLQAV